MRSVMVAQLTRRAAVVGLAAVLAVGGCSSNHPSFSGWGTSSGVLRDAYASTPAAFGKQHVPRGAAVTFYTTELCVLGGPVRVRKVELAEPRGLKLQDWAWRRWPKYGSHESGHRGLARSAAGFHRGAIHQSCGSKHWTVEFDITLASVRPNGITDGFRIVYGSEVLFVPEQIFLCEASCPAAYLDSPW